MSLADAARCMEPVEDQEGQGHRSRASISRIMAVFHPQRLLNGRAVDAGPSSLVDVTDQVLALTVSAVQHLQDCDASTDALVPYSMHMHDGLYRVEVVESICRHFGTADICEVREHHLQMARSQIMAERAVRSDPIQMPRHAEAATNRRAAQPMCW